MGHWRLSETELSFRERVERSCAPCPVPKYFVSPVDHERKTDRRADVHILQAVDHLARAVLHQERVDDDQSEAKLSRSQLQVTNLQTVSRGKREKRAEFITGKDREHDQNLVPRPFGEDERITDDHRAQKKVVKEMIHVVAPSHQTRTSILSDLCRRNGQSHIAAPPSLTLPRASASPGCQVREKQNQRRPHQRQHG